MDTLTNRQTDRPKPICPRSIDAGHENSRNHSVVLLSGASGFISLNKNLDRHGKVFVIKMAENGLFKPVQIFRSTDQGTDHVVCTFHYEHFHKVDLL